MADTYFIVCDAFDAMDIIQDKNAELTRLRAELAKLQQQCADLKWENERLRELLIPCRPDTDAQTDPAYPATVNDILHLLSCYIADFLPNDVILSDEYFAAWERQARPVVTRLFTELSALRSQVAAALAADGQWMEQTGELRKQVARLRSLLARYREHVMAHESIDYLEHHIGMPPTSFLRAELALSADDADEIRAIGIETISDQLLLW